MHKLVTRITPRQKAWTLLSGAFILLFLIVPRPKFNHPTSTVVESTEGHLLGARIASDGQWRFPAGDSIPKSYIQCLLQYEDRWFYKHPGINPVSLIRAFRLNLQHRKVISGGSTITMQVARLSRNNPKRTYWGKILEMAIALKLELLKSKSDILMLYAANAPMGGNVVGIEAASWRYFGRSVHQLSMAEAATLAVLPNAPAQMYPGKNDALLKQKRNDLLKKLYEQKQLDSLSFELALAEPIPNRPQPLPSYAPHLTDRLNASRKGERLKTSIQHDLQKKTAQIINRHHNLLKANGIHNLAAIVIDVRKNHIIAYQGNCPDPENINGGCVDIITSKRSTGSILKPFLFAEMLDKGVILPQTLVRDIPLNFSGYTPKNFTLSHVGMVHADKALSLSLNIPFIELLSQYGTVRFLDNLRSMGFSTFNHSARHYGLSLIVGGGEANLYELTSNFAMFAKVLNQFDRFGHYDSINYAFPHYLDEKNSSNAQFKEKKLSAASIWFTLKAMQELNRPNSRMGWQNFASSGKMAWKTGTSYGFRDAWAIGVTPEIVIGVWAGNADGEGRPGLIGVKAAAPVLFDLADLFSHKQWFEPPIDEITYVDICKESGFRASENCPNTVNFAIPQAGLKTLNCPYHGIVHLSQDRKYRVNSNCYPVHKMITDTFFVLPPAEEQFYLKVNPEYRILPPFLKGCEGIETFATMDLLYPRDLTKIYVPIELDGQQGKVVFEAAHRQKNATIYWHIDQEFVAKTNRFHQIEISPANGKHQLTLVDENGVRLSKTFTIIDKKE